MPDDHPRNWLTVIYCGGDCKGIVTVEVPVGVGVVEFLESMPTCPKCGKAALRVSAEMEKPRPVGES